MSPCGGSRCAACDARSRGRRPAVARRGACGSDRLEDAIRAELGEPIEVETHIEPLEVRELAGHDAEAEAMTRLAQTIRRLAAKEGALIDVHDVRLRVTDDGLYAIFHCRAPRETSVQEAHEAVDALERAVRRENPRSDCALSAMRKPLQRNRRNFPDLMRARPIGEDA